MFEPIWTRPKMDVDDPIFVAPRTDIEVPNFRKSKQETSLPKRKKLRTENVDPSSHCANTLFAVVDVRTWPITLMVEPSLTTPRELQQLPICTLPITVNADPALKNLRSK